MKLEEIAHLAGVSRTTASYVVNGKAKQYRVSDRTIARVMSIVEEYNFHPNAVAAGLRAGKTHTIGIIIPDLENISYTRIANYLEQLVRQQGYQLLLSCSEDNPKIEKECISHLKQRRVDALVISSACISATDYSYYNSWDNQKTPLIALDRTLSTATFRNVTGSDSDDARTLANKFNQFAYGSVVYLGALPELPISRLRLDGFKQVTLQHINHIEFLYANNYSRQDADLFFSHWLESHPIPDGLFTTSFALLQGAIDAILRKQGHLPKDFVIATFGDHELLDFLPCKVIALGQNHKAIAEITMSLLLSALKESEYQSGITHVPRQLSYRGSLNRNRLTATLSNK